MTDTANRILWIAVGLLLTIVGAIGIATWFGRFPFLSPNDVVLDSSLVELWHRFDPWNLIVAGCLGAVLIWFGLWLFTRQFRRRGSASMADLTVHGDQRAREDTDKFDGHTTVRARGLVHALERDLTSARQIAKASVTLTGTAPQPNAWLRLDLARDASLSEVRDHVGEALTRFATTSDIRPATVDITVRPSNSQPVRVR